ncbi:MAG: hypothetical protein H6772_03500 [Pseudomonadales bacterium]|nr:hypothetical protein [Pseudomonadales bacterium]
MKLIIKKSLLLIIATYFYLGLIPNDVNAVVTIPSSCTGFCMVENQLCPSGSINPDPSCQSGINPIYNGNACCVDSPPLNLDCGASYDPSQTLGCNCDSGVNGFIYNGQDRLCCGWVLENNGSSVCSYSPDPEEIGPPITITDGLSSATFNALNPLKITNSPVADQLSSPGGIVSRLLSFLFPLAGLLLFLLITWGGFEILLGSANQKGMEAGKNRITAALAGFFLLFASYWLAQIVEVTFGVTIL